MLSVFTAILGIQGDLDFSVESYEENGKKLVKVT